MEVPVAKLWKPLELDAGSIAEAFRIDDLLDFSNEEIAGPIGDDNLQLSCLSSDSSVTAIEIEKGSSNSVLPKGRGLEQAIARDFCVPCEDVTADLEWLSNFVEDSFSTDDGHKPINLSSLQIDFLDKQTELSTNREQNFQVLSPVSVLESSATSGAIANFPSVPGKARSKRPRGGARVWSSSGLLGAQACQAPGYGGSGSTDSGSSGSITYDYPQGLSTDSEILMAEERGMVEFFNPKKYQKQSRGRKGSDGSNQPRRCTHCLTQRTPQWRAGPMGPKTLCNACGVRFKSGRLVPEYRPAGSPTFVSEKHSNSHRKILEMRRLKESDSSFLRHESVDLIQAQQQIFHSDSVLIDTHDQILHPNSVLIQTHPQSLVPILTQHRIHHSDPVLTDSDHFFEQIEQEELHSPRIAVSEEHASESKESASEKENVVAEEDSVGFEKSVHENVVEGTELEVVGRSETSL